MFKRAAFMSDTCRTSPLALRSLSVPDDIKPARESADRPVRGPSAEPTPRETAISSAKRRLRDATEELGHIPTETWWVRQARHPPRAVLLDLFGSWPRALAAAGLATVRNRSQPPKRGTPPPASSSRGRRQRARDEPQSCAGNATNDARPLSRDATTDLQERAKQRLREAAHELGHSPSEAWWLRQRRDPSHLELLRLFVTWPRALAAAGLPTRRDAGAAGSPEEGSVAAGLAHGRPRRADPYAGIDTSADRWTPRHDKRALDVDSVPRGSALTAEDSEDERGHEATAVSVPSGSLGNHDGEAPATGTFGDTRLAGPDGSAPEPASIDRELPLYATGLTRVALTCLSRAGYATAGDLADLGICRLRAVCGPQFDAEREIEALLAQIRPCCDASGAGGRGSWLAGASSAPPRPRAQGGSSPPTSLTPFTPLTRSGLSTATLEVLWSAGYTTLGEVAAGSADQLEVALSARMHDEVVHALAAAGLSPGDITREHPARGRLRDLPIAELALPDDLHAALARAGFGYASEVAALRAGDLCRVPGLEPSHLSELRRTISDVWPREAATFGGVAGIRTADAAAMALAGMTLQEIGNRLGVTRERARQLLEREGLTREQLAAAKASRRAAALAPHSAEVLRLFADGLETDDIAARLGLGTSDVKELIREHATGATRAKRQQQRSARRATSAARYTDHDLISAIRRVAEEIGDVPSSTAYDQTARRLGLPSLPTIANRFDGWAAAVEAAGMRPHATRRHRYVRRWDADACWRALRRLTDEIGAPPTVAQYELLAEGNDELPSSATVRNRLGRWSDVVARLHGDETHPVLARLGLSSSTPPDERTDAVWLAYLADEVADDELARLAREGLFVWNDAFGARPEILREEDDER
jgi:DNA-binding CsgD family transcriptional regulator